MERPTDGQIRRALNAVCPYDETQDGWEWQTCDAQGVLDNWGDPEAIGEHLDDSGYVAVACDMRGWGPLPELIVPLILAEVR